MKSPWTLLCCAVLAASLTACKSSTPASTEGDSEAQAEATTAADETTPAQKPDIPAPPDVAAVPKDAEKSESGLAWKVLQKGEGHKHPGESDIVRVNFTGWTSQGLRFDGSSPRRTDFPVNSICPGWTEGVQLMVVGEKRRFWIPEHLGAAGRPQWPPGTLVYDIELIGIRPAGKEGPIPPRATPNDVAKIPENAKRTKSGLAWRILEKGTGSEHPTPTSMVSVNYAGWTTDGKMFDTSALRGGPATYVLGDLMPGWQEGVQMMVVGETRRFWIPENLVAGGHSGYPPGMLVYDIQLVYIKN